jgi:hypothetical protein
VGGAGYWLVARTSPDAAFSRVWLDVGLAVFLAALVTGLTQGPAQQIQRLVDMLRGISIGQRDRRVEPERFGDLEELARACNEIAAALTEHEDPNLGEVQRRRRTPDEAAQKAELEESLSSADQPQLRAGQDDADAASAPDWRRQQLEALSEHPDVGPVRVRKKPEADDREDSRPPAADAEEAGASDAADGAAEAAADGSEALAADDTPTPALHDAPTVAPATVGAPTEVGDAKATDDTHVDAPVIDEAVEAAEAAENVGAGATVPDTPAVDLPSSPPGSAASEEAAEEAPEEDVSDDASAAGDAADDGAAPEEGQNATPPQDDPLEALFDAYISAKKEHGEPYDDLELTTFVATIRDESERLRESHQCRDVRFEVRVQDGEVSLLPRLLR